MKIFFQSFKFKVFALFSIFILVISLSFTFLLFRDQSKSLTGILMNNGRLLVSLLGHTSKIGIVARNKGMLKNSIEGVLNQDDVISVFVYDIDGKVIDSRLKTDLSDDYEKKENFRLTFGEKKESIKNGIIENDSWVNFWSQVESKSDFSLVESFVPQKNKVIKTRAIGYVSVVLTKKTLKLKLAGLLIQCVLIALIFITVGSVVLYFSVNQITEPLNRLTKEVRAIGRSDKVELIPVKTGDEIGKLTRAFNEMYISLENRKSALLKSEEKFNQFFYDDIAGAFIADLKGKILDCNPSFAGILGYSVPSEIIGRSIKSLYKEGELWDNIVGGLEEPGNKEPYNSVMLHRDGFFIYTLENTLGIFHEGELFEVKGYVIDVSKQKSLEEQLRQSQKMEAIGTLAGGIAHDFNNILYPIMGYTEMALEDLDRNSELYLFMEEILKASKRAKDLVLQILSFSHKTEQEKKPINIHFVVKEALKLLRASIPSTIDIVPDLEEDGGFVLADSTQIHQVVMNLGTNAYHAMESCGGVMKVTLKMEENEYKDTVEGDRVLELVISDSGEGIDPEIIEKIFDPYFTTKEFGKGTGLGLSVVHGIVKSTGGDIAIKSEPEKGTEVRIIFPVVDPVALSYDEIPDSLVSGREKILVVDDETQIADMTSKQLIKMGYNVSCFTDSQKAFDHFSEHSSEYSLILTDQIMKNITGTVLAKKAFEVRSDIPVILCTGFADLIVEKEAYSIGIKKVIQKPVHRNTLSTVIRDVINS